ncbi:phosphotransferase family protein [Agromyces sp. NPDC057679]|uniref:phosphotransferase family protein n=1 Tax=Agromyces sp. NPDC057679 TaxID=3346207 RepID=UPI0036725935
MDQRRPFSAEVTSSDWLEVATAWASSALAPLGARITAVAQPRVRPWSTQLVIDAEQGGATARFWFKANCRAQRFEPGLQAFLASTLPDAVTGPIAVDRERGWMLAADHGDTLRDARGDAGATAEDWLAVVGEWARVQRALVDRAEEITALGVPDCSPGTVPDRFELMLARVLGLPPGHPSAPDDATASALRGARSRVDEAVATLAASGLPTTLQHGDLHPGNVFATTAGETGRLRVFDFGDAQWAHPVEAILIPMAVMEYAGLDAAPVEAVFREAWSESGALDDDRWTGLVAAAEITQAVNRSLTWWDCLAEADESETDEWGEAVLRHLVRVLGRRDG